jgi:hypothetical protein
MRALLSNTISAAAALLILTAGAVEAQGKGKDKQKDKNKERVVVVRSEDRVRDERVRDERRREEVRRDGRVINDPRYDPRYDPRVVVVDPRRDDRRDDRYGTQARRIPPGLAKKPGGMPPGQYKKLYGTDRGVSVLRDVLGRRGYTVVRTQDVGESEYVYYRLRDGETRRAIVSPGRDRLQFSNVPQSMLSEVLSKLY